MNKSARVLSNSTPLACPQCEQLKAEWKRLGSIYGRAARALHVRRGLPTGEYERLRAAVDEARIATQAAQLEYEKHQQRHALQ